MNLLSIFLILIIIVLIVLVIIFCLNKDSFKDNSTFTLSDKFDAYYINLKRRPDKNKKTLIELNKSNLLKNKMKRFEAIDGKDIDLINYLSSGISKTLLEKRRGWIGCAFSHIELWQKCIDINKPMLIFEDDNIIKEKVNYDKHLETIINNFPNDFDMLYLVTETFVSYKRFNNLFVKITANNAILSAYFISPKGAKKLLDFIIPYKPYKQIDFYIKDLTKQKKINCYLYRKSIMYTIQDFNTTDIQVKSNYIKKFQKNL